MRRLVGILFIALLAGCSGGDGDDSAGAPDSTAGSSAPAVRFCDAYLDYIESSTDANLALVEAAGGDEIARHAEIVRTAADTREVIAAVETLDQLARERCQAEWIGAAQGAGTTAGAAEAFFDALVNGDRIGALNIASVNAIARFEPWGVIEPDPDLGTPAIASVGDDSFTMVLDEATVAECRVDTGVVFSCQVLTE